MVDPISMRRPVIGVHVELDGTYVLRKQLVEEVLLHPAREEVAGYAAVDPVGVVRADEPRLVQRHVRGRTGVLA